jgi:predicted enzyme related to lactoylglutathione lyase
MIISNKINYVEFPARDIQATKAFFANVFGWTFEDFGPEYTAFSNQGIDGGFFRSELLSSTELGGALVGIGSILRSPAETNWRFGSMSTHNNGRQFAAVGVIP